MPNESRIDRLTELHKLLAVCPTDIYARCDLASLLEELGQYEKALFNWKAVVASDPNNLKAWEGMTRCRNRTGRPPQSHI
jgi:tetratricopeptide (TPR) repeat protein